jgi:hypothetical protein
MSYIGRRELQNEQPTKSSYDEIAEFSAAIRALAAQHRPSRMPFFRNLAALDHAAAADPSFLGRIHLIYQAAMHATRAAVYFCRISTVPHSANASYGYSSTTTVYGVAIRTITN